MIALALLPSEQGGSGPDAAAESRDSPSVVLRREHCKDVENAELWYLKKALCCGAKMKTTRENQRRANSGAFFIVSILVALSVGIAHGSESASALLAAENAIRSGNIHEALALTQVALQRNPKDFKLWTVRGIALAQSGNRKLALSAFMRALEIAPSFVPALQGGSESAFLTGARDTGPLLKRLLALTPSDATAHAMLAVMEARSNNCVDAIKHFKIAQSVMEGQAVALTYYGVCLATIGRFDDAIVEFRAVSDLRPQDLAAKYNLALARWRAGDGKDALETLKPELDSDRADPGLLGLAADIEEADGDTPRAVDLLQKALHKDPKNLDAYLSFSTLAVKHTSEPVAVDVLSVGIRWLPRAAELYLERGIMYARLGKYQEASDDFEAATRIDPSLRMLETAEGLLQDQEQHTDQALTIYRLEAQRNPDNALDQFLLAEALSNRNADRENSLDQEAIHAALRAIKKEPQFVAAHDLLSRLYLRSGYPSLAIAHARTSIKLDPSDQPAIYNLIQALKATHQTEEIPALAKRLSEIEAITLRGRSDFRLVEASSTAQPETSP